MDEDLVVALRLQEEWDARAAQRAAQRSLSLVDASWELVDPTPDLRALFVQFNDSFFWGQLEAVEVKWSARMTLSAGICCYEGHGGMCSIRLSEPLLKLRPRKDLVETLLHEMIHAYLFVTNNDKDRDGHGPEFCKHMRRINCLTGANITVYHTFHDEVDEYRQHWWRCDGPCQSKQPYYGYVKRAINRAPSAHDSWWAEHQKTCGGTYVKVREPESYSRKGSGKVMPPGSEWVEFWSLEGCSSWLLLAESCLLCSFAGSAAEPQGRCGSEDRCAGKRRRLGDQATAGGTEAVSSPHPPAWRPSPDCGQSHLVSCPVCKHSVMESEVNEHLDWCLERGGTGGRN
ncbi:DNA-dependent metalloprotease SPRTN [Ctenodactylus gundi]